MSSRIFQPNGEKIRAQSFYSDHFYVKSKDDEGEWRELKCNTNGGDEGAIGRDIAIENIYFYDELENTEETPKKLNKEVLGELKEMMRVDVPKMKDEIANNKNELAETKIEFQEEYARLETNKAEKTAVNAVDAKVDGLQSYVDGYISDELNNKVDTVIYNNQVNSFYQDDISPMNTRITNLESATNDALIPVIRETFPYHQGGYYRLFSYPGDASELEISEWSPSNFVTPGNIIPRYYWFLTIPSDKKISKHIFSVIFTTLFRRPTINLTTYLPFPDYVADTKDVVTGVYPNARYYFFVRVPTTKKITDLKLKYEQKLVLPNEDVDDPILAFRNAPAPFKLYKWARINLQTSEPDTNVYIIFYDLQLLYINGVPQGFPLETQLDFRDVKFEAIIEDK